MISVPLAYVYLLVLRDQANRPIALTAISALKGAIAYLIVLVPHLLMNRFTLRPYSGPGLYLYGTVYDFLVPGIVGFLLYLWWTRDPGGLAPEERCLSLQSFFAGLFTLAGLMDVFVPVGHAGTYTLFLLPALRIALMLLAPILYYHYSAETIWLRYLYLVLMAGLPFALGVVPMLSLMNLTVAASLATAGLFLGGWAAGLLAVGGTRTLRLR